MPWINIWAIAGLSIAFLFIAIQICRAGSKADDDEEEDWEALQRRKQDRDNAGGR